MVPMHGLTPQERFLASHPSPTRESELDSHEVVYGIHQARSRFRKRACCAMVPVIVIVPNATSKSRCLLSHLKGTTLSGSKSHVALRLNGISKVICEFHGRYLRSCHRRRHPEQFKKAIL